METFAPGELAIVGGLLIGGLFGALIQRTDFCMMGGVAEMILARDTRRFKAWLLAIAVAIAGTQALVLAGVLSLDGAHYLRPSVPLAGIVLGGLMFGFGMTIACGCGSRSLVNAATGDLRALTAILVLAVFALMALHGLTAYPRLWIEQSLTLDVSTLGLADAGVPSLLGVLLGTDPGSMAAPVAVVVSGLLAWHCVRDARFRAEPRLLVAGVGVGLLVTAGWALTGWIAVDAFTPTPPRSLTFVAPVGESLLFVELMSGTTASFGVAVVGGVLLGAFLAAWRAGKLKLQPFEDLYDMRRYMIGGALMGTGGVMALGCTVGQGITGLSSLSLASVLAFGAIVAGGVLGTRYLEEGRLIPALRASLRTFARS